MPEEEESEESGETPTISKKICQIAVWKSTKDKLDRFGRKNETYAQLMERLIDKYNLLNGGIE